MIGWIKGRLMEKQAPFLLIDVNGIGYEIQAPMTTFYKLPDHGMIELFTHFVVREDAQLLYGFATKDEQSLFRSLIKVNGVGPKLALAVLSSIEPKAFVNYVHNDDVNALVKIPGIGKKTAERLLVEMRDRLKDWFVEGDGKIAANDVGKPLSMEKQVTNEAESALVSLGYKPVEATKMIVMAKSENAEAFTTAEALIKAALKRMI
jgi:holliday junction DNA helicase RuvA